jgi:hypothetical protein
MGNMTVNAVSTVEMEFFIETTTGSPSPPVAFTAPEGVVAIHDQSSGNNVYSMNQQGILLAVSAEEHIITLEALVSTGTCTVGERNFFIIDLGPN